MAVVRKRGGRWQADILKPDGKRIRKGFKSEAEAQACVRLQTGADSGVSVTTFEAFIDQVFPVLWGDVKRPDAPRLNCNVLLRYIPPETPIPSIDEPYIEGVIRRMKSDGKSNATINRKLSALSKLLRYAARVKVITERPTIDYLKENKGRDRILSPDEEIIALNFFEYLGLTATHALTKFLLYTGCRTGEAWKLDRLDVTPTHIIFRDTKNGSDRMIPAIPQATEAWNIVCRLSNHDRPFMVIPKETYRLHFDRLKAHLKAEDDKSFVPHMLRHTCATRLVQRGVDLPRVMKWMGHKNIQTTMRYAHLAPDDLDLAANALMKG